LRAADQSPDRRPVLLARSVIRLPRRPHAGNLLYDEPTRQLIVLDWALAERLDRESRRQLVLLAVMTMLRNPECVVSEIEALAKSDHGPHPLIRERVQHLFEEFHLPGVLQAMMLLDELALEGVRFPRRAIPLPKGLVHP
jgi:predicted unusual protein kinase regulating ubiquinone biosynthesis (AarF/ABC1/UbiB family)